MTIKIIAGKYKGAKIITPDSARPTLSRSKQIIFDILESFSSNTKNFFENKIIFDCFAGSGSFGIEALSRGADFVYFADIDKNAIKVIHKNIKHIDAENSCCIMKTDIQNIKNSNKYKSQICDILFLDPPYGKVSIYRTIEHLRLNGWLNSSSIIVTEEDKKNKENLSMYTILKTKEISHSTFKILRINN